MEQVTPEYLENVFTALYEQAVTEGFVGTFEQFVEIVSTHARDAMIQKSQPNRAARRAMVKKGPTGF